MVGALASLKMLAQIHLTRIACTPRHVPGGVDNTHIEIYGGEHIHSGYLDTSLVVFGIRFSDNEITPAAHKLHSLSLHMASMTNQRRPT